MYDHQIKLVKSVITTDEYGDRIETKTERTVFAELKSISQAEFYQALTTGFKPELKFVLADYLEYQGEKVLKYQDFCDEDEQEYSVIRTFRSGNELEIICKRGVEK